MRLRELLIPFAIIFLMIAYPFGLLLAKLGIWGEDIED